MKLSLDESGGLQITFEHEDPQLATILLMADIGANDRSFFQGLLGQVAKLGSQGRSIDEEASNFVLSVACE